MRNKLVLLIVLSLGVVVSWGQKRPQLVLPVSHTTSINLISYSHDNKYILTASEDKTIKVWDIERSRLLHDLKGHTEGIAAASFSADDKYILSVARGISGTDKSARVWDLSTGTLLHSLPHNSRLTFASFSINGKRAYTSSEDNTAKVWETVSGKLLGTLQHESDVIKIIPSADDKQIITCTNKNIFIWDASSFKQIKSIPSPDIQEIGISPDNKKIVVIQEYKASARILNPLTGNFELTIPGQGNKITSFFFSPDSKYLAITDIYNTLVWDLGNVSQPYMKLPEGKSGAFDNTSSLIIACDINSPITRIYDLKSKLPRNSFNGEFNPKGGIQAFVLSDQPAVVSSNNKFLACNLGESLRILDISNGEVLTEMKARSSLIKAVTVSPKGNFIAYSDWANRGETTLIDGNSGRVITKFKTNEEYSSPNDLIFSNDEKKLVATHNNKAYIFEIPSGNLLRTLERGARGSNDYSLVSPDNRIIITVGKQLKAWDAENGNLLYSLNGDFDFGRNGAFSRTGKLLAIPAYKELVVIESSTGKIKKTFKNPIDYFIDCSFSPDEKFLLGIDGIKDVAGYIYDLALEKVIRVLRCHAEEANSGVYSPDGSSIITTTVDGEAFVWDASRANEPSPNPWKDTSLVGKKIVMEKPTYRFKPAFSFTKNWMLIAANAEICFYDLSKGEKILGWVGIDKEDFMVYRPDNYYLATPNAARWINWKINNTLYDFDQWDIKYNRPDIIIKTLQNSDTSLIRSYKSAYIKRLTKMSIDSSLFRDDYNLPEISIPLTKKSKGKSDAQLITIKASETEPDTYLSKIFITVNGNPVFGKYGFDISKEKLREKELSTTLPLCMGANTVKFSCLNNRGAESIRKQVIINYDPPQKRDPKTWFIGIGVSQYKNANYNLTYPEKDINDISELLRSRYKSFEPILLLNNKATKENILAIKQELLQKTSPDDIIVVSLNGHGLLDKNLNFYFGTYDIDFNEPSLRGLAYEDVENMLDKVVACKKLVMIDACHSGDLDPSELQISSSPMKSDNVKELSRGAITVSEKSGLGAKSTFELLQELFTTLNASNGATVISASGGKEFAYEGKNWNNGVFTYCFLSGIKEMAADIDKNSQINISELQTYVTKRVSALTNGRQRPTSRQLNFDADWIIWK